MASDRAKLVLDEQSFQGLLAAAFTIQQHNARMNAEEPAATEAQQTKGEHPKVEANTTEPQTSTQPSSAAACKQCGASLPSADAPCPSCAASFRPGERLQRNWASLWHMSQEQGSLFDARRKPESDLPLSPADPGRPRSGSNDHALQSSEPTAAPIQSRHEQQMTKDRLGEEEPVRSSTDSQSTDEDRHGLVPTRMEWPSELAEATGQEATEDSWSGDAVGDQHEVSVGDLSAEGEALDPSDSTPEQSLRGLAGLRVKLRFHRADLFLGLAILVAVVALLLPASGGGQKTTLHPWERMLIAMGILEEPQPVVHFHGDPDLKVWVDPHTALYYCPGDELYGKSPDGHYTTQREAQSDRFEPAERSVCVQ